MQNPTSNNSPLQHKCKKFAVQFASRILPMASHAGGMVICVIGSLIFLFLFWYSFRFTQYMPPDFPEFPCDKADSVWQNLLTLLLFGGIMAGLMALEGKLSEKARRLTLRCLVSLMVGFIAFASLQWIFSADRVPAADQFYICHDACNFMQGIYISLQKGYYCELYPQQLGLIALLELLFSIAGPNNYLAFEVISALLAPCIAFLGYRIVREITDNFAVSICYCLMMAGCLPLIFYTSYVYGEIPSIFFSFLAVFLALRYERKRRLLYLIGIVLSFSMAFLVRKNSLILMIAFCLAALLWSLDQKDKKMLATALLAIAVPYLAFAGVQQMYEVRSGTEKSAGIPASAWISLGLQEHDGRFGWYYGSGSKEVYTQSGSDREKTDAICRQEIKERLNALKKQPSYAIYFFKQKQLSQWNAPLYQSYFFSQNYADDENTSSQGFLVVRLRENYMLILGICDKLQLILYLGMLFYFLFAVKKEVSMLQHILPIMIIGGFFFSMVWEAKARYILPYYMAMFPMAVIGYQQLFLSHRLPCILTGRGFRSLPPPRC